MLSPLKYKRLKKEINDKEEKIIIERDVYNSDTGSFKETVEEYIDPETLAERFQILRNEAAKVEQLKDNIDKGNFDKVADKRDKQ